MCFCLLDLTPAVHFKENNPFLSIRSVCQLHRLFISLYRVLIDQRVQKICKILDQLKAEILCHQRNCHAFPEKSTKKKICPLLVRDGKMLHEAHLLSFHDPDVNNVPPQDWPEQEVTIQWDTCGKKERVPMKRVKQVGLLRKKSRLRRTAERYKPIETKLQQSLSPQEHKEEKRKRSLQKQQMENRRQRAYVQAMRANAGMNYPMLYKNSQKKESVHSDSNVSSDSCDD